MRKRSERAPHRFLYLQSVRRFTHVQAVKVSILSAMSSAMHAPMMEGGRMRRMRKNDALQKSAADWRELSRSEVVLNPAAYRQKHGESGVLLPTPQPPPHQSHTGFYYKVP